MSCLFYIFRDIQPKELVEHTEYFTPTRVGERKIVATFESTFLNDMSTSKTITVE